MVLQKISDHDPPGDAAPKGNTVPKATYAAKLKQATTQEQEKIIRELAKKSGSAVLHPTTIRPTYRALYSDLKQLLEGRRFSLVPNPQGTYTFTPSEVLDTQLLKTKCSPHLRLAECDFKMTTFDDDTQEYILRSIPEYIPRGMITKSLSEVFGNRITKGTQNGCSRATTALRQLRGRRSHLRSYTLDKIYIRY